MRTITDVIDAIFTLLPNPAPDEVADDLIVLSAELRILRRTGAYTPPDAHTDEDLWGRLGTTLYRYLPNPAGYPWAQQVSDLVTKG